jgi:hypothetical protein
MQHYASDLSSEEVGFHPYKWAAATIWSMSSLVFNGSRVLRAELEILNKEATLVSCVERAMFGDRTLYMGKKTQTIA